MKCEFCGNMLPEYNWKYCTKLCRNKAVAKKARNTFRQTMMVCLECGKIYKVRNSQKHRSKYCSRKCQGKFLGSNKHKEIIWNGHKHSSSLEA